MCTCAWSSAVALAWAAPSFGQQQVTVTAARTPLRVSEVVADVTVLDRSAIERAEGRTLVELLSQQAGLQFSSNGGLGKASSLYIRGLESRHTLLLVDGVRIFSATLGTPSLDNLPLEAIERIEIVRGPMSSLYGNGAMGGVVQVFTRRGGDGFSGNAKLAVGSQSHRQAAGGASFGGAGFDVAAQVQHTDTQGFSASNPRAPFGNHNPDRDGFRQTTGSLRLGWQAAADWRVEGLALQSTGTTAIDDGPGADARAGLENRALALSLNGRVDARWRTRLSLSEGTDIYDTLASASAFASLGAIKSRSRQLGWENSITTPLGSLLTVLERLTETVSRPGAPFAVSERDIDSAALGLSGSAAGHAWQASARHDRNSQFGSVNTGALGYAHGLTPNWRVGASYGTSHTLPSFNQLYFPNFGSPTLLPEEGRHGEVFGQFTQGDHLLRAAYYQHRYRGFITSGPQPVNLPRVEIDGVTVSYEGRVGPLALTAALDHTDPRNRTNGNANFGKLLPRRAQDALRLGADWQSGAWSAGATLAGFSDRFDDSANTTRVGGYGLLDLRAEWALQRDLRLGLKLNNLADKTYETVYGYNQPGREAFLILRYAVR
ncbi:MAG: TonB-dependent receptor [Chitinophagaceae bacterium]|nr:TonB-dependent receptor [Rubrivivax sp.]